MLGPHRTTLYFFRFWLWSSLLGFKIYISAGESPHLKRPAARTKTAGRAHQNGRLRAFNPAGRQGTVNEHCRGGIAICDIASDSMPLRVTTGGEEICNRCRTGQMRIIAVVNEID
jgi:hypothetical protein